MRLSLFGHSVTIEPVKKVIELPQPIEIDRLDVIVAITDLYDEYIQEHGADYKSVFFIATRAQVARRLGVTGAAIDRAIKGEDRRGFAEFKKGVLARHGRGNLIKYDADSYYTYFVQADLEKAT